MYYGRISRVIGVGVFVFCGLDCGVLGLRCRYVEELGVVLRNSRVSRKTYK